MRAKRVDGNHSKIIAAVREAGFSIHDTSAVGQGFPDLVCGYGGRSFIVEIKDGSKAPSARKLTVAQERFKKSWQGDYSVITSVEEAWEWAEDWIDYIKARELC